MSELHASVATNAITRPPLRSTTPASPKRSPRLNRPAASKRSYAAAIPVVTANLEDRAIALTACARVTTTSGSPLRHSAAGRCSTQSGFTPMLERVSSVGCRSQPMLSGRGGSARQGATSPWRGRRPAPPSASMVLAADRSGYAPARPNSSRGRLRQQPVQARLAAGLRRASPWANCSPTIGQVGFGCDCPLAFCRIPAR